MLSFRAPHTTVFALALASAVSMGAIAGAQTKKSPKVLTLTGCVERDEKDPTQFTLTDKKAGRTFRLTGIDLREYLQRPVQVEGGVVVKGFAIKGGLQPNPNIAAQAGAMDPSRAAVAAATASSSTGNVDDVQEFKVKTIKPAGGECQ